MYTLRRPRGWKVWKVTRYAMNDSDGAPLAKLRGSPPHTVPASPW